MMAALKNFIFKPSLTENVVPSHLFRQQAEHTIWLLFHIQANLFNLFQVTFIKERSDGNFA